MAAEGGERVAGAGVRKLRQGHDDADVQRRGKEPHPVQGAHFY